MAYNYFPGYYQQIPMNQQAQNSAFVSVQSIQEAFNWPVAPGNSITFKDENQPFVYTKTKGFSPLEQPTFEKYRLVKVEENEQPCEAFNSEDQIKHLWSEVTALKAALEEYHGKHADDRAVQTVHAEPEPVPEPARHPSKHTV